MEQQHKIKEKRSKKAAYIKKMRRRRIIFLFIIGVSLISLIFAVKQLSSDKISEQKENNVDMNIEEKNDTQVAKIEEKEIVITAVGDCTLGTDTEFGYQDSIQNEIDNNGNDYSYIMKNVEPIFKEDDYTIANLETTFTESTKKRDKGDKVQYHFKGPKEYVQILKSSSIEGVTLSNNHIFDYGSEGFNDTINVLKENNINYCGEENKIIKEIKGIKVGFLGYCAWYVSDELKASIAKDISTMKNEGVKIVIPYFHWGIENSYEPNDTQKYIAKFSIDNGADMVLGSHPHVIQSIEKYNGKLIAYSLGNFSFGGNRNPNDKSTYILQSKFKFKNDAISSVEFKVIPTRISSVTEKNDYVPTPIDGIEGEEILGKLNELSETMREKIKNEYLEVYKYEK